MNTTIEDSELARLRELEAGAAVMREALGLFPSALGEANENNAWVLVKDWEAMADKANAALATHAGRELLKDVERLRSGEKWAAEMFCKILATAISGFADMAVIANQKVHAGHTLAAVEKLRDYAKEKDVELASLRANLEIHSDLLVNQGEIIAALQRKMPRWAKSFEAAEGLLAAVRIASCLGAYTDYYVRQEADAALTAWQEATSEHPKT